MASNLKDTNVDESSENKDDSEKVSSSFNNDCSSSSLTDDNESTMAEVCDPILQKHVLPPPPAKATKPCLVQRNSLDVPDVGGSANTDCLGDTTTGVSLPPPALKQSKQHRHSHGDCSVGGITPKRASLSNSPPHIMTSSDSDREDVVEQIGSFQASSFIGANNASPVLPGAGPYDHTPIVNLLLSNDMTPCGGPLAANTASSMLSGGGQSSAGSSSFSNSQPQQCVCLLVDGVRFLLDTAMLTSKPETTLGKMFLNLQLQRELRMESSSPSNSNSSLSVNGNANSALIQVHSSNSNPNNIPLVVIGREGPVSAAVFGAILDYYRSGVIRCPLRTSVQEMKEACDYFRIPFNHHTVKCSNLRAFLHEVSNDGAHDLFEKFLEDVILPVMVKCAQLGERESHIVVLLDDEVIDWDEDYPPQMPENELNSQIVHSTQMYRFLKYIENREVAKLVLSDRGMKKIRIGIEGYPTYKEKIKKRPGYRPEVIYNYAQRPFLRMSWEEEEHKSRHVDFQCVTSKSLSDLTSLEEVAVERPVDLPNNIAPAALAALEAMSSNASGVISESPPVQSEVVMRSSSGSVAVVNGGGGAQGGHSLTQSDVGHPTVSHFSSYTRY